MPHVDLRRQRGRRTRERLIQASLKLFGAQSFKSVTTRAIANAARVNQASILYHFGGKRELYLTVADRIASDGRAALQPLLEKSRTHPTVGFEPLRVPLIEIVQTFARHLWQVHPRRRSCFVRRPRAHDAWIWIFDDLRRFHRDLHAEVTALLGKSTARYPREESTIIDAHALVGAALSFVVARKAFAQRSYRPVDREERVEAIAQRIAEITTRLTEPKFVPRPVRPLPASPLLAPRNRPRKSRTARMKAVAVQGPLADPAPEA